MAVRAGDFDPDLEAGDGRSRVRAAPSCPIPFLEALLLAVPWSAASSFFACHERYFIEDAA